MVIEIQQAEAGLAPNAVGHPFSLSVVIPAYRSQYLTKVLDALVALPTIEIIVVDSSPDPPSIPDADLGRVSLVSPGHRCSPAEARNIGGKKAKGDWLLFVDADVALKPEAIEFVKRRLLSAGEGDVLISGVYDPSEPRDHFWSRMQNRVVRHRIALEGTDGQRQFYSSHFLIPRKLFRSVGGFNESLRIYEDVEFAARFKVLGGRHEVHEEFEAIHLKPYTLLGLANEYVTKTYHVTRAKLRYPEVFATMPSFVSRSLVLSWLASFLVPGATLIAAVLGHPLIAALIVVSGMGFVFGWIREVLRPETTVFRLRALAGWPLLGVAVIFGTAMGRLAHVGNRSCRWLLGMLDFARAGWRVLFRTGAPVQVINYVTSRCNLRCEHCYYKETLDNPDSGEMPLEIFDRTTRSMGPLLWYAFGGGEPVVRKDLDKVVEIVCRNSRPKVLSMPTNGWYAEKTFQLTLRVLQRLDRNTSLLLFFSVDGPREIHDQIRGPKSYDKVKETMELLRPLTRLYPQLHLNVTFTVTPQSAPAAPVFIEQIAREFQPHAISVSLFRYHSLEHPALPDYLLDAYRGACASYERLLRAGALKHYGFIGGRVLLWKEILQKDLIYRVAKNDEFVTPCTAGTLSYVIMEDGRLLPCEILSDSLGNVLEEGADFGTMRKSTAAKELRAKIRDEKCRCTYECSMSTNTLFSWPMSRRLAVAIAGDWLGGSRAPEMVLQPSGVEKAESAKI